MKDNTKAFWLEVAIAVGFVAAIFLTAYFFAR